MDKAILGAIVLTVSIPAIAFAGPDKAQLPHWVSSWAAPPVLAYSGTEFGGLTTREMMHATIGGGQVRLRISNLYGTVPLAIGAAHIAVPTGDDTIDPNTDTALTFAGAASVAIPVGSVAVSDAVAFGVTPNTNYAVSIYTPQTTGAATSHYYSSHDSFYASGDQVSNGTLTGDNNLGWSVFFVSGLDVAVSPHTSGIVAIGDSITDGYGSTFDSDTNWPDALSNLLSQKYGNVQSVTNVGISGNSLLTDSAGPNGLARFDRDVLALPGTTRVIEAEGINDLGIAGTNPYPGAADLIAGLQQMINRAHEKRITIYGATLTPAGGSGYYNSVFEQKRQAVNTFIRSGAFDGFLDFDRAIRDPAHPTQMLSMYDSGDHLHPNSAGYAKMAQQYRR